MFKRFGLRPKSQGNLELLNLGTLELAVNRLVHVAAVAATATSAGFRTARVASGVFVARIGTTTSLRTVAGVGTSTVLVLVFVWVPCVGFGSYRAVSIDGGLHTVLAHDDDDSAVASESVEGDGVRPSASEVNLSITALGCNLDGLGVLCSVGADSSLNIVDSDIFAINVLLCQCLESQGQSLAVEAVVAVGGRTVALGREGLLDGTQVQFEVQLDHLEDGLTDLCLRSVVSTGGHGWSTADISDAVTGYIRDTIDGAFGLTTWTDLINLCHNFVQFKLLINKGY